MENQRERIALKMDSTVSRQSRRSSKKLSITYLKSSPKQTHL